jgi:hypothetical protein
MGNHVCFLVERVALSKEMECIGYQLETVPGADASLLQSGSTRGLIVESA